MHTTHTLKYIYELLFGLRSVAKVISSYVSSAVTANNLRQSWVKGKTVTYVLLSEKTVPDFDQTLEFPSVRCNHR